MAAIDPGAPARPARPAVPPRPRRTTRTKATYPYLNRELSWLEFNARVLHEARDERNPLLERVKFLAIFASNLDEFFQVRVAGLRQQVEAGKVARSPDGLTADEQLAAARARVLELVADHSAIYVVGPAGARRRGHRAPRLRRHPRAPRGAPPALPRRDLPGPDAPGGRSGPPVPVHHDAQPVDRGRAARSGDRRARLRAGQGPADPAAPARGRPLALRPARPGHRGEPRRAVPGMEVEEHHLFRVTRNADFEIEEDEADDLLLAIEEELRRRRFGAAVRLEVERSMPDATQDAAAARTRSRRERQLRGQRDARPDRAVRDRRSRPARPQARAVVAGARRRA